jgi:predicted DsbA family dithiol-disulfide isomerase
MYSSYFEKSLPLFSHLDLCSVAESVGIASVDVMNILESDQFKSEAIADRELATQLGATGVPFFVVDMKYAISGAQPLEAFVQTINTAWSERTGIDAKI